jgi:hypothetical protein
VKKADYKGRGGLIPRLFMKHRASAVGLPWPGAVFQRQFSGLISLAPDAGAMGRFNLMVYHRELLRRDDLMNVLIDICVVPMGVGVSVSKSVVAWQFSILNLPKTDLLSQNFVTSIRRTDFVRPHALVRNTFYLFDESSKNFLLIGIYFDADLISEVDVNLGTP